MNRARLTSFALILVQLILALLVVYQYRIEGAEFFQIFILVAVGFTINLLLPMKLRKAFFVLLSFLGAFVVFGVEDAFWLIGCGLLLIALCHLPIPPAASALLLLGTGAAFAVSRSGIVSAPWSDMVWPILGSMFMFRIVLYARAVWAGEARGGLWGALAYFFMLPNLIFPLFPVVDYHSFQRTHYDRTDIAIYQQGLLWIARGLLHLILYRFIYHFVLNDPADVEQLSDLVRYLLGTFLLYLRVSGMFHLIVGILHLFGFRLPETHRLYYLAHNFTELWRRINIYWKDFMTKVVFYPVYFRVKALGPKKALVLATSAVFATTWVLHSYQWFWLRGGFPVTLPDILFWGVLGLLVVFGVLRETKPESRTKLRHAHWNWRRGLQVAGTFGLFCLLWSLWSTESVTQWFWIIAAAANVDGKGIVLLGLTVATLFVLGSFNWRTPATEALRSDSVSAYTAIRTIGMLTILLALGLPVLQAALPPSLAEPIASLKLSGLNVRDAALQHRGYYEQLNVRSTLNTRVLDVAARPADWQDLSTLGVLRDRHDMLLRELRPLNHVIWNGRNFSTNSHGMRDGEYSLEKPEGTLRIALLGPSHVMGNGVADGETFESLVEERLNLEQPLASYQHYEILNFGVDGYSIAQQVTQLEQRVFDFQPDVVIITTHRRDQVVMEYYLLKLFTQGIKIPHAELQELLRGAGVEELDPDGIPLPFSALRSVARSLGLNTRMSQGEADFRVRRVGPQVYAWWAARFAQLARARGVEPLVLALNAVIDDPNTEYPGAHAFGQAELPILDLSDIYRDQDRPALRVGAWDDHPNAAGHRVAAERLYPELIAFLKTAGRNGGSAADE